MPQRYVLHGVFGQPEGRQVGLPSHTGVAPGGRATSNALSVKDTSV